MSIHLKYAARSDVGLVRKQNQDSGYAGAHLCVLADGMGGPAGGDIASSVAVAHLVPLDGDDHGADDLLDLLRQAVASAHAELVERSSVDDQLQGMGTTCIALLRSGNKLAMVHVGDSRAYLLHAGELTQITTDHSFVQYLVQIGQLSPEEAAEHPQRSVLLRVLGDTAGHVDLDESVREAVPGDRWLLCSDGLSGVVSYETIAYTLRQEPDPAVAAEELIKLALRAGGPDNITCVIADVVDSAAQDAMVAPQVVGAAATDRLAKTRGGDSAAARAAALVSTSTAATDSEEDTPKPRKWKKRLLLGLVALLLAGGLTAGGYAGYQWTQTQYYVAVSGKEVLIYKGIPQTLGPIKFSAEYERTGILVDELDEVAQARLVSPIARPSLEQARAMVKLLKDSHVQSPATKAAAGGDTEAS